MPEPDTKKDRMRLKLARAEGRAQGQGLEHVPTDLRGDRYYIVAAILALADVVARSAEYIVAAIEEAGACQR